MNPWKIAAVALVIGAGALISVSAQTPTHPYSGESDYQDYCSSCHGSEANGDGAIAKSLLRWPSDLTALTRRNNYIETYGEDLAEFRNWRWAGAQ